MPRRRTLFVRCSAWALLTLYGCGHAVDVSSSLDEGFRCDDPNDFSSPVTVDTPELAGFEFLTTPLTQALIETYPASVLTLMARIDGEDDIDSVFAVLDDEEARIVFRDVTREAPLRFDPRLSFFLVRRERPLPPPPEPLGPTPPYGVCAIDSHGTRSDTLVIELFALRRDLEGEGVGSWFMRGCLANAYAMGYKHAELGLLSDNRTATAFVLRMGAHVTGETREWIGPRQVRLVHYSVEIASALEVLAERLGTGS